LPPVASFDRFDKIALLVIDCQIRAQIQHCGAFDLRSRGCEDLGSKGLGKLNGCRADTRCAAVNQKALAGFQAAALKHIVPDREEGLGNRCSLDESKAIGCGQRIGLVNHTEFGISAARHQRTNLVAEFEPVRRLAHRNNLAGNLKTRNVGRTGRWRIGALPLQAIWAVDPGGSHLDEKLCIAWRRRRAVRRNQHLWTARLPDFDCTHPVILLHAALPEHRLGLNWQQGVNLTASHA
jgi:hypothetical protein